MRRHTTSLAIVTALSFLVFGAASASAAAPAISLTAFSHVTTSSATLEADINPEGKATLYHFEYGPADCASNPCTSTPVPDDQLAKGNSAVRVEAVVEGLAPGTTYHFRVVAKNGDGTTKGPDRAFSTHLPPPVFGPCPNDAFRPELSPSADLSDCRAYEQASPVNKNGQDVTGSYSTVKASAAGDAVTFAAGSGLPGGTGAQTLPVYLASRGSGGWSTLGTLPPQSAGEGAKVIGWTTDFSQVFGEATKFGEPTTKTFLARSSADGSLTTIVPHTAGGANYSFAGASADGTKVFFEATKISLTPDADPGVNNLYVWDRASNEISLVGVLPDSACGSPPCVPPGGSFAGPYNWDGGTEVATGGGALDSHYTQDQHAISSEGSSVYFTVGNAGQIYLRKDPAAPGASTVHVSASKKKNGVGLGGTDAAGTRPAAFMAATPDGSKAFFTSSEKLTNDATTGPEPVDPPSIARADIGGKTGTNIGFLPARASGIAVDGTHVYWANSEAGTIGRAKLNGEGKETEFITGADNPQDVAVDAEYVYWTNAADLQPGTGSIGRAKKAGGSEVKQDFIPGVVEGKDVVYNPRGIAVDAGHVYWANRGLGDNSSGSTDISETKNLMRANIDGSGAEELNSGDPEELAVNGTHIYYTEHLSGSSKAACIRRVNLVTKGFESVTCDIGADSVEFEGIALDASHLYWTASAKDRIIRANLGANLDDSEIEDEFITTAADPRSLAVDSTHLYWTANQEIHPNPGNDLYRYDADTGDLTDLAPDVTGTNGAEIRGVLGTSDDGSYVYFAANGVLTNTPNAEGEVASPGTCPKAVASTTGTCNLYLAREVTADEFEIEFVAQLTNGNGGSDSANWLGAPDGPSSGKTARVTPGGRTLLLRSRRQLTDYDNKGNPQLYRYSADTGEIDCVTCNPTGAPPVGSPSSIRYPGAILIVPIPASILTRNLSEDGDRVFFESIDALVAGDTNGDAGCPNAVCQDVYMWEAKGSGSCESEAQNGGCLYLLSSGNSPEASYLVDASASGDDVFIITRDRLVGQDGDQLLDVYDVRVGGGLASQNEVTPVPCEGDPCKRAPTAPPETQSPGSALFVGPPDPNGRKKPKPRCPKSKRRVRAKGKTRCVAKQRKQRKRNAKTTRRASR